MNYEDLNVIQNVSWSKNSTKVTTTTTKNKMQAPVGQRK